MSPTRLFVAICVFALNGSLIVQSKAATTKTYEATEISTVNRTITSDDRILTDKTPLAADREEDRVPKTYKAAIFIINRGGVSLNKEAPVFEDLLTAQLTAKGFAVISRELTLNAVADFLAREKKNSVDEAFSEQTSAIRLSQNLGADYLIVGTLTSFETETRKVNAYNVKFDKLTHTLRTTYRIVDGFSGETLAADATISERSIQQDKYSQTEAPDLIPGLIAKASTDIAAKVGEKVASGSIRAVDRNLSQVTFRIAVSMTDVNIPEVVFDEAGEARVTANTVAIEPLAVTVELNGVAIGSTGTGGAITNLTGARGFHRLRLTREDLTPWERMVNIQEGTTLNVAMQLSPEGLARWKANTEFLSKLKKDSTLNRAEAAKIKGWAKMLENSYFRVDL